MLPAEHDPKPLARWQKAGVVVAACAGAIAVGAVGYVGGVGGVATSGAIGTPSASIGPPTTPTLTVEVFAATGDSLRIVGSTYNHPEAQAHDTTEIQVDTITADWSSPTFTSVLGAVETDTATGLDSAGVYKARIRYGAGGTFSAWSDSVQVTMVAAIGFLLGWDWDDSTGTTNYALLDSGAVAEGDQPFTRRTFSGGTRHTVVADTGNWFPTANYYEVQTNGFYHMGIAPDESPLDTLGVGESRAVRWYQRFVGERNTSGGGDLNSHGNGNLATIGFGVPTATYGYLSDMGVAFPFVQTQGNPAPGFTSGLGQYGTEDFLSNSGEVPRDSTVIYEARWTVISLNPDSIEIYAHFLDTAGDTIRGNYGGRMPLHNTSPYDEGDSNGPGALNGIFFGMNGDPGGTGSDGPFNLYAAVAFCSDWCSSLGSYPLSGEN